MSHRNPISHTVFWPICVACVVLIASGCISVFSDNSAFVEGEETNKDISVSDTLISEITNDDTLTSPDTQDDTPPSCEPTAGGIEICDGLDNDCNNATDEGCDDDLDLYCDSQMQASDPLPAICTNGGNDCDDLDGEINPNAAPRCVISDLDCDNIIDAPNLSDLDVIRDPNSSSVNSDIIYNGNNLASVWVESTRDTLRVRFGIIATNGPSKGQFLTPPSDISPISHSALDAALAWDDTSNTYGVAWIATSPESSTPSVFFAQFDTSGSPLSDPIRLDDAAPDSLRVINARKQEPDAAGYFVVLYNKTVSAQNDVYASSIPILPTQPPTFSAPQRVASGYRLADASIAWHPGTDDSINDSTIYLLWTNSSSSPERLLIKPIKASNATSAFFTSEFDYPPIANGYQSRPMIHNVNNVLYMTWGINDSSVTPSTARIGLSELDPWGNLSGTVHNLVSGSLSAYEPRALISDPNGKAVLLYRVDNASGTASYHRRPFNISDWRSSGAAVDTGIDGLTYSKSFNLPFFSTPDQGFFTFDQYAPNDFFEIFHFYDFGTTATVTVPASKAARSTPITNFFFHNYLPDRDAIEIIQLNALDNTKIERAFIESDGNISASENITARPENCNEWAISYVNNQLICSQYDSDYESCISTVNLSVFNETSQQWNARTLTFAGPIDPTNGCSTRSPSFVFPHLNGRTSIISMSTDWAASNGPEQIIDLIVFDDQGAILSDQNLLRFESVYPSVRNFKVQNTDKSVAISFEIVDRFGFKSGNVLSILDASGVPIFSQYFGYTNQGLQPYQLDSIFPLNGRWWLGGSLADNATETAHAVISSVDETSGVLSAPITLSERYSGTGSVQLALANDTTIAAAYRTQTAASQPFIFDWSLAVVDIQTLEISTPVPIFSTPYERTTLHVAAFNDYIAVAIPDATNPTIKSFNTEGQPIGEGALNRALPFAATSLFVHNGDALRWLLRADANQDGRLFHITAMCDENP